MQNSDDVMAFWFDELSPKDWFVKNPEIDQQITKRFGETHRAAVSGELHEWRITPTGRLAEIIVIDQFSRNMYRDQPDAFAHDVIAVVLSQAAIQARDDQKLADAQKSFVYMPLMHSESLRVHQLAMQMFAQPGLENNFKFEKKHLAIIEQFGRYPHRNKILQRVSTPEELAFLNQPGSSF